MSLATWELLSHIVTVIGLPLAIFVFLFEQRKERENEEEEVYQLLSDNYQDFLKVAMDNPDLGLISAAGAASLTPEQQGGAGIPGKTTWGSGWTGRTSAPPCRSCCTARTRASCATSSGWPASAAAN